MVASTLSLTSSQEEFQKAWKLLKAKGYKLFDRRFNAAYESGHSDYIDPAETVVQRGIVAPDGTEFESEVVALSKECLVAAFLHCQQTA